MAGSTMYSLPSGGVPLAVNGATGSQILHSLHLSLPSSIPPHIEVNSSEQSVQ